MAGDKTPQTRTKQYEKMKEIMKGKHNDGEGQEKMTDGVERET